MISVVIVLFLVDNYLIISSTYFSEFKFVKSEINSQ